MIIAKQKETEVVENGYYELFQPAKALGINGEEIDILQSIGFYSLAQLEQEKQSHLNQINSINDKIEVIEAL